MSTRYAFLNVPFDRRFEPLLLAYVVGLTALGFKPRCVLEVSPSGSRWNRLDRLKALVSSCEVSVHDLSRVELTMAPVRCPQPAAIAPMIQRGQIWWVDFSEPRGSEPGYRHPAPILQREEVDASRLNTVVVAWCTP